jgi:hypothetical protein
MLSDNLKRLQREFENWTAGTPYPTETDWHQFRRDLKNCVVQATMLELGVDLTVVDVAVEAAKPQSNVVILQPGKRRAMPIGNGDAS